MRRKIIKEEPKKFRMTLMEFLNFKELARRKRVEFQCEMTSDLNYLVQCEDEFMTQLGF